MQTSTASVIGYGKVPVHGDFVRYNANGTAVRALDDWLQEGLYLAKNRLGGRFQAAYDATPIYRFLFAPHEARPALVGVLQSSRDSSGRSFPFLVASEIAPGGRDARDFVLMPVRFGSFLDHAARLTGEIVSGQVGHRELGDWLGQSGLGAAAVDGYGTVYDRYIRDTTLETWCQRCWGHFDDSRKYVLFRNLVELLTPLRGNVPPGFSLGLRFPLGTAASPELEVAFWIDLCFRLMRSPEVTPVFFWTVSASETVRGYLTVFFRLPPARVWAQLLPAETDGDYLCDLETMGGGNSAEAVLVIPPRVGALLESKQLSLHQLLERL